VLDGLVSVVIPCFNYARYLEQSVGSLIRQSYPTWECIIVDDGSTDHTLEVCNRLAKADRRVRYVHQRNAGLSAARNSGIREARGEFLQFLDADDLLEPEKLNVQVAILSDRAGVDLAVSGAAFFRDGEGITAWPHELLVNSHDALAWLIGENKFPVNAVLIRSAALRDAGHFDESLKAHEDWDLWLRCALQGRRFECQEVENGRALVRKHDLNMSKAVELMARTAITVRERLEGRLPASLRGVNHRQLANEKWRLGLHLLREWRFREGWSLYCAGVRGIDRKAPALLRLPLVLPLVPRLVAFGRKLRRAR
jgi:glycosyltransferase involved in cell wall biosynthesis